MQPFTPTAPGDVIYPGHYVPNIRETEFLAEIKNRYNNNEPFPPLTITDKGHEIEIQGLMPGLRREDFMIQADGDMLTLQVMHKEPAIVERWGIRFDETRYTCLEKKLRLPANADLSFISAEYRQGILHIVIPTYNQAHPEPHVQIIVY